MAMVIVTMHPAESLLHALLRRAEQAATRTNARMPTQRMTPAGCPAYHACASLDEREAFEAVLLLAERAGGVGIERDDRRFGEARLVRLRVVDAARLAAHLGVIPRQERVDIAARRLTEAAAEFPIVEHIIARWRAGKRVRGEDDRAAGAVADAARLVLARRSALDEALARRESARIFGDSKRIEALTPWLDVLLHGELLPSGLDADALRQLLGLRHASQPLLLAAEGEVVMVDGAVRLCRPWIGLPMEAVTGLRSRPRWLMTIENLQTFNEAALQLQASGVAGAVLYTAGMPSPRWSAAYQRILADLPHETTLYHWGDLDVGGYRIAQQVAVSAGKNGRVLQPWRMSPQAIAPEWRRAEVPSTRELAQMRHAARSAGWDGIADALAMHPLKCEQEALPMGLPSDDAEAPP